MFNVNIKNKGDWIMETEVKTKRCRVCKLVKLATTDYFYRDNKSRDKLEGQCCDCKNKYKRERRKKLF